MKAPFPWFGGKSRASHLVWRAFGDVPNYVEPFAGSLAVLLGRPHAARIETVNDLDCYLANFWRAVKERPDIVAEHADWPVNEADLHARHRWLVAQEEFRTRMRRDPDFFDAKIAGWWVWGICQWIGAGWCAASNWNESAAISGHSDTANEARRPHLKSNDGILGKMPKMDRGTESRLQPTTEWEGRSNAARAPRGLHSVEWQGRPDLTGMKGVHRRVRNLDKSVNWEKRPQLGKGARGVHRTAGHAQLPQLGGSRGAAGRVVQASGGGSVYEWMNALADRLRRVRVCCGDWSRILGRSATECIGVTGVMLDPPYSAEAGRDPALYSEDSKDVAHDVRAWCIENGGNKKLRIALCGYEGEHDMPADWQVVEWKANGGYAGARGNSENSYRERIWFSPHCDQARHQGELFVEGT